MGGREFSRFRDDEEASLVDQGNFSDNDAGDEGDGYWKVFGTRCMIDVNDAEVCFVFPRGDSLGGVVNEEEMVENPYEEARKIFYRPMNPASEATLESLDELKRGPMTMSDYQQVVRDKLLELLMRTHMFLDSFDSIDGDEAFLKIGLNPFGEVIKELAERYRYYMPYNREAYVGMPDWGHIPGGVPMTNKEGVEVFAYSEYQSANDIYFQPFRSVDVIRIINMRLNRWVNIEEMEKQCVISMYFPVISMQQLRILCRSWANPLKLFSSPWSHEALLDVRDYFGEEVAFFFLWLGYCIGKLCLLCPPALIYFIANYTNSGGSQRTVRILEKIFTCVTLFWAASLTRFWEHHTARVRQAWGMQNYEERDVEREAYDPFLEGTFELRCRKAFGSSIVIIYLFMYVNVLFGMEWLTQQQAESGGHHSGGGLKVLMLTAIVRSMSLAWSYIAKCIVGLQNDRTRAGYNNSLAYTLSTVKLFIALWPFVRLAFVKNITDVKCFDDVQALAQGIWPTYASQGLVNQTVIDSLMSHHHCIFHQEERICATGCYLLAPFGGGDTKDETNCTEELRSTLLQYYIFDQILTIAFLFVPMIKTKWAVDQEVKEAASNVPEGQEPPDYSLLQYQAKCCKRSPYQFGSWGGSQTEDFLQVIIGFVLMTSFAIMVPGLCVFALFSAQLTYKLMAFRMANVTCRPLPNGAEGIGFWEGLVVTCFQLAIIINVALAIFSTWPTNQMDRGTELFWFLLAEHGLLAVSITAAFVAPAPSDVPLIQRYNALLEASIHVHPALPDAPSDRYDYSRLDVGLRHRPISRPVQVTAQAGVPGHAPSGMMGGAGYIPGCDFRGKYS